MECNIAQSMICVIYAALSREGGNSSALPHARRYKGSGLNVKGVHT